MNTSTTLRLPVILLAALALAIPAARAELLLYDGFATATDSQGRTAYSPTTNNDSNKLINPNSKSDAWTTGVSSNYPWSEKSGVIWSRPNDGLSLPAAFADESGDQFSARGGSAGYKNGGTNFGDDGGGNNDMRRAKNRAITSSMPTTGKLYYRCLMMIDKTAFDNLKTTSWKYHGTGISAHAAANEYNNQANLRDKGLRIAFTSTGNSNVGIYLNFGGQAQAVLSGISSDTTYIAIVELDYDTGTAKAYAAPISGYSKTFAWTVENIVPKYNTVVTSAMKVMFIDGHYQTNTGMVLFDEIAVGTQLSDVAAVPPSSAPVLGGVSLSRTGTATYEVAAELAENTGDLYWIADDGVNAPTTNLVQAAVAAGTTVTGVVSSLAADRTWQVYALATNASGSHRKAAGILYTGALAFGTATDANEYGLVAGGVQVSRANGDPWPLAVDYTLSGSAGTEGATWVAPVTVTIPAGQSAAVLPVVPLRDDSVAEDVDITVALAQGNYELPSPNAAMLTLANLAPVPGKKVWAATAAGNASDGANWIPAGAPASSDDILFDGGFSSAACNWDAAAPHSVASWEQKANYTGTVTFHTTYEAYNNSFTQFTIDGDVVVAGGAWAHPVQGNTQGSDALVSRYRLAVSVGGDMSVSNGVNISGQYRGRYSNNSAWGGLAMHGGYVISRDSTATNACERPEYPPYGSILEPTALGLGASGGTGDAATRFGYGGGAVLLDVDGDFFLNGRITVNGDDNKQMAGGSGGSVYVHAANIAFGGNAKIDANGGAATKTDGAPAAGSGGRVALVADGSLAAPIDKILVNGSRAGDTVMSHLSNNAFYQGAAGTIWLSSPSGSQLVIRNVIQTKAEYIKAYTPVPAGDDAETFKRAMDTAETLATSNGRLRIVSNVTAGTLRVATTRSPHIDLYGNTLTVGALVDESGNPIAAKGTYTLADATANGWTWFEDSSAAGGAGTGTLVVGRRKGTCFLMR